MNFRSYTDLRNIISSKLPLLQTQNFDLIVGIPRSGMIPAYIIALYLNKHCCDLSSLISNTPLKKGITRKINDKLQFPSDAKKILIVDDSIMSGKSLERELMKIPNEIRSKITTMAIYSSKKNRNDVDFYLEYVSSPRVFEWNIFHHNVIENSCFDIDGVLCVDPTEVENDDGERYIEFLNNAKPLFIPTVKIKCLVTSRLEKYRTETENWLKNNGVKYDSLIMLDLPSKEERQRLGAHSTHKASVYKNTDSELFFESERDQAIKIYELTKKPVYCVGTNEMYSTSDFTSILFSSKSVKKSALRGVLDNIPTPIYNFLRSIYRVFKK